MKYIELLSDEGLATHKHNATEYIKELDIEIKKRKNKFGQNKK